VATQELNARLAAGAVGGAAYRAALAALLDAAALDVLVAASRLLGSRQRAPSRATERDD